VTITHGESALKLGKNVVNVKDKPEPKPNRSPNPYANSNP